MNSNARVKLSWILLRYSYGIVILLAGLDKIFRTELIVQWFKYISPFVLGVLPVSVPVFLIAMGIVEILVAIMMLTRFPRVAGYLSVVWLLLISINLLLGGYVDIAIRDILLAIGAYVLTELTIAVEENQLPAKTA